MTVNLDKWVEAALYVKHGGPGLSKARSELEQESLGEMDQDGQKIRSGGGPAGGAVSRAPET